MRMHVRTIHKPCLLDSFLIPVPKGKEGLLWNQISEIDRYRGTADRSKSLDLLNSTRFMQIVILAALIVDNLGSLPILQCAKLP